MKLWLPRPIGSPWSQPDECTAAQARWGWDRRKCRYGPQSIGNLAPLRKDSRFRLVQHTIYFHLPVCCWMRGTSIDEPTSGNLGNLCPFWLLGLGLGFEKSAGDHGIITYHNNLKLGYDGGPLTRCLFFLYSKKLYGLFLDTSWGMMHIASLKITIIARKNSPKLWTKQTKIEVSGMIFWPPDII